MSTQTTAHRPPPTRRRTTKVGLSSLAVSSLLAAGLTTGVAPVAFADNAQNPDFGPNVTIFEPAGTDPVKVQAINTTLRAAATDMSGEVNHWTNKRRAFFFKPGTYGDATYTGTADDPTKIINTEVGYYTSVAGLGATPDQVTVNGAFTVNAEQRPECTGSDPNANGPWNSWCAGPGSLNNFWRSLSNIKIKPIQRAYGTDAARLFPEGIVEPNRMRWAVSQAAPMRRVHIAGDLTYMGRFGAHASGGFTADSKIDGVVQTGSQQQFYHRDSALYADPSPANLTYDDNGVWNMVFSGTTGAPVDNYPDSRLGATGRNPADPSPNDEEPEFASTQKKHANYGNTPISREAPFLTWDASQGYGVWVPAARTNVSGVSWTESSPGTGTRISLNDFVIAKPGTNGSIDVAALNTAIANGKHILFTPGEYLLSQPLNVSKDNTVVLGLGLATLRPINGTAAISVGDVIGAKIAGLMIEAHTVKSKVLVEVGPRNATKSSAANPTTLSDIFFRIGGAQDGNIDTALEINSDRALVDNIWSWRADHGDDADVTIGYKWERNPAAVGARINGDNVTATGLFVEHYQKVQTEWNGENGQTIFYQSEIPYEPETQAQFTDRGREGYSSYKVDPSVVNHRLFGAGVYSYYRWVDTVWAENAISIPKRSTVKVERAVTRWLNGCIVGNTHNPRPGDCTTGKGGGIRHIVNDQGAQVTGVTQADTDAFFVRFPQTDCGEPNLGRYFCSAIEGQQTKWMRAYDPTLGDVTNPALSVSQVVSGSNVNFTATASDAVTATNKIHIDYKIDDDLWAPGASSFTVPNSAKKVVVRAVDQAGNVSTLYTWTNPNPSTGGGNGDDDPDTPLPPGSGVNPDKPGQGTNPPGSIVVGTRLSAKLSITPTKATGKKGWHKRAVTVAAQGTIVGGTAGFLQIKVGKKAWRTYTGPVKVKTNSKKLRIYARVVSGNKVSPTDYRTVKIDTKKPTKLKAKATKKKRKGARLIALSAKDKTSKIAKIRYQVNGKGKWRTFSKKKRIRITAKVKSVRFRAIDKAGNKSKIKRVKVKTAWRR